MYYQCLIVDDELELAESTTEYFNLFDVSTAFVTGYEECLDFLSKNETGLILLDINLKDHSGFVLCKHLRQTLHVPILFVSARTSDDDILMALHIGGDDYIKKPYSLSVLLAKVQAVLRRLSDLSGITEQKSPHTAKPQGLDIARQQNQQTAEPQTVDIAKQQSLQIKEHGRYKSEKAAVSVPSGRIILDENMGRVYVDGREVKLKALEYRLLVYFIHHKGRIISKEELFEKVWQDRFVTDGTLNVHIRRLREKLEKNPNEPVHIVTAWGRGYSYED